MKKKITGIIFFTVMMLVGCASPSVTELKAPDGTSLKNVKCHSDTQKCFVLATESCKESNGSYRVVASHSNAGGAMADLIPGPFTWYNLTFACGASDGRMPNFAFRGERYTPPATVVVPSAPVMNQQQILPRTTTTNCTNYGTGVRCTTN